MTPKQTFVYWIEERIRVKERKERGQPKPWSDDPVFQTTYFCNADREDDKVTRWVRQNFKGSDGDHDVANYILARMVNKPDTLRDLGWPWNGFQPYLWEPVMSQPGAWGSAYIVSTNGRKQPKHEYIAGLLERAYTQFEGGVGAQVPPTLEGWHKAIQALPGMGSFMSAQVVADLKNTSGHPLASAEDWHYWASHGPGSLRGLSWFWEEKITPKMFMDALASARTWVYNSGHSGLIAHLCNQNLQNCFCEYDKYCRVSTGTGRSKRKYDGR
jgi:hypothetical protein